MPIELFLEEPGCEPGRLVSIVSRDLFDATWRPVAERLGLGWVAVMGTGFTVRPDDVPTIVHELQRLDRALRDDPPVRADARIVASAIERVDHLLMQLQSLSAMPGVDAYLG